MPATRTFLGVALDSSARGRVTDLITALSRRIAGVRWVAAENLHYTLHFLGDVEDVELHTVCRGVIEVCRELEAFGLDVDGIGAFPKIDRPRTLWIGAGEGRGQLVTLHERLGGVIREMGFRVENRPFTPHLTIGRVGGRPLADSDAARLLQEHGDFHAGTLQVSEVVVYGSELSPSGPAYHVIGRAPLG